MIVFRILDTVEGFHFLSLFSRVLYAGNEFCERLAFYGISTNLVIYLESVMKLNAGASSIQTSLFSGTCYLTPLLGAWLADGYWGRYRTIMVFSIIYAGVRSLLASITVFVFLNLEMQVTMSGGCPAFILLVTESNLHSVWTNLFDCVLVFCT